MVQVGRLAILAANIDIGIGANFTQPVVKFLVKFALKQGLTGNTTAILLANILVTLTLYLQNVPAKLGLKWRAKVAY